jgi:hypothetical protein
LETQLEPPLFEALIANSVLVCVTLMRLYIFSSVVADVAIANNLQLRAR